jgi:hypothetical protein
MLDRTCPPFGTLRSDLTVPPSLLATADEVIE